MTSLIPVMLAELLARHPRIDFYLEPGTSLDLYRKVVSGDLDAAVVARSPFNLPKSCDWHTFREEPLVLLTPAAMEVSDPHLTLQTEPILRYDRNSVGGQIAESYLRHHGITPHQRCELDGLGAIAALVDRGLGVSLVPNWTTRPPSDLSLARWPLPLPFQMRLVGLIWRRSSVRLRLIQAFLQVASEFGYGLDRECKRNWSAPKSHPCSNKSRPCTTGDSPQSDRTGTCPNYRRYFGAYHSRVTEAFS